MQSKAAFTALVTASTFVLGACGGPDRAEPAPHSSSPTSASRAALAGDGAAVTLVRSAIAAADGVDAVHFVLRTTGSLDRQQVLAAQGNLIVKPATAAIGTATVKAGAHKEAKFILLDEKMYADIGADGFVAHRAGDSFYDVAALFDPADGIPDILRHLQSATAVGDEDVDGVPTTKVTGTATATDIAELAGIRAPHGVTAAQAPVTVWIQRTAPHHVVRIAGIPQAGAEVQVTLSKWGEKVSITAPSVRPTPTGSATATPPGVTGKPNN